MSNPLIGLEYGDAGASPSAAGHSGLGHHLQIDATPIAVATLTLGAAAVLYGLNKVGFRFVFGGGIGPK